MTLDTLAYFSCLLKNDLHTIHLHAGGKAFDKIHEVTQQLYEEAESEFDELAEFAITEGCKVDNINNIRKHVSEEEWPSIESDFFNEESFVEALDEVGHRYLDAIKEVECEDIHKPYLDEIGLFWSKQIDFLNAARRCEEGDCTYIDAENELDSEEGPDDFVEKGLEYIKSDDFIGSGEKIDPLSDTPFESSDSEDEDKEEESEEDDSEKEEDEDSKDEE